MTSWWKAGLAPISAATRNGCRKITVKGRTRRSWPLAGAAAAAALAVAGATVWLFGSPASLQQQVAIGGPFHLVNSQNQPVTEKTFAGKFMLVTVVAMCLAWTFLKTCWLR